MADHAIRTVAHQGSGYSVVDFAGIRHVLAAAVPRCGVTLDQQLRDALCPIEAAIRDEQARASIVHQTVFLADISLAEECRRILGDFYGSDLPATSYLAQPSCTGKLLAIEALGVGRAGGEVTIQRAGEHLVVARHDGLAWVHVAQNAPPSPSPSSSLSPRAGVYQQTLLALEQTGALLSGVGVGFEQVVRTWLYVGGMGQENGFAPPYQELNRARTSFYRDIPFLANHVPEGCCRRVYPASTGIGMRADRLALSAIALASQRSDIRAVPLENPRQTAAYEYAASYSPESPKFCRAMAVARGDEAVIFISGTASITAAETRHSGDAAAQAEETLDNIAALIGEENLGRHGLPGLGASLAGLGLVRVYVKRQADYARVRAVCRRRLGQRPTIYALAEVCRPDLLVEMEGVAFSRLATASGAG